MVKAFCWASSTKLSPPSSFCTLPLRRFIGGLPIKPGHKNVLWLAVESQGIGNLHDVAVAHHANAVAHGHGLHLIVGHIHHRSGQLGVQSRDLRTHVHPHLRVQIGKRLVKEEYFGIPHDRSPEGHSLALASGKRPRLAVQHFVKSEAIRGLGNGLLDEVLGLFRQLQPKADVVKDRHVRIERVVLKHHGYPAILGMHVVDDAVADGNGSAGDVLQPRKHPQGRRLPTPRRTHQNHELAVLNLQIDVLDCGERRIAMLVKIRFDQVFDVNRSVAS